jgi:hypothetical protein
MNEVKTVGVKDLKNKLSAYLREVRTGVRLLVSDRDTVIAELHEPYLDRTIPWSLNPLLSDWVRSGTVRLPVCERRKLQLSPVRKAEGTAANLLDQDRGESGS